MKKILRFPVILFIFTGWMSSSLNAAGINEVSSPDGKITVKIVLKEKIYYTVYYGDELVIYPSPLSLTINDGQILGKNPELTGSNIEKHSGEIKPLYGKRKIISDVYNELILDFKGDFGIKFRVYDDGVAYRFTTNLKSPLKIIDEEASFYFTEDHRALLPVAGDFQTSFEQVREWMPISEMNPENFATLPAVIDYKGKLKIAITDADVRDYPCMYIYRTGNNNRFHIKGKFAPYPLTTKQGGWGLFEMQVTSRENYIAMTSGKRSLPWRVMVITDRDGHLAETDMIYKLASPAEIDGSWVKPGLVSWEWWNDWNLEGVDFKTGINDTTYRAYIDFASENGIPYVIMDEGWSDQFDLTLPAPALDVPGLMKYAEQKNVRLILWCVWFVLDNQMEKAMEQFAGWGAAGVKVDFLDRDDQQMVNFQERCARTAAKYHLMVDFHGCPRPTGLSRTYPNIINYEGVIGNEYNKFSSGGKSPTVRHNVTIPFTRMLAGPMDYTPGAMRNSTSSSYSISNSTPMSHGTRCQQLGMYIVYDAPLQMLCDAPTQYTKYPDILSFLSSVPVSWDETFVPDGEIGEYIVTIRKKGNSWYAGGLTNETPRDYTIDFGFLPEGTFTAEIFSDGVNAHKLAEDYSHTTKTIRKGDKLTLHMAPGGGFAMILK